MFIYNNYSSTHSDLLQTAGTQYLHVKRLKPMACEVFKIVNNISPSFIKNLIELKTSKYSMRRTKPVVVLDLKRLNMDFIRTRGCPGREQSTE